MNEGESERKEREGVGGREEGKGESKLEKVRRENIFCWKWSFSDFLFVCLFQPENENRLQKA